MKETQHIEWKESWRDEYLKWISGFANAEGGVLVIGKNDAGKVVGVADAEKLLVDLPNKVRDTLGIMVAVNLVEVRGKEVIEIHVDPYPSPISYKGEYHYRSGSTKQELKGAALERFLLKKRGRHWDAVPEPGLSADALSAGAFALFVQKAIRSGRMHEGLLWDNREAVLENLELTENSHLKRAAGLLFSDRPERYVSGAWIKVGFFMTDDDLRYQDEIHGNLFEQVEKTLELLQQKYMKAYISYEGIQRRETFLFPLGALREALLNAIVHKDYSSGIPIQISVYEHQIVFWNAGELPEKWDVSRLLAKHPSKPYNPLIANAFFRAGYIESWGRGIETIKRECETHGIDAPSFDTGMSGLMLTFLANAQQLAAALGGDEARRILGGPAKTATQKTTQETTQETTQKKILALINAKPTITRREMAEKLALSEGGIKYHLQKMRAAGLIRHVGPTKAGSWEVQG